MQIIARNLRDFGKIEKCRLRRIQLQRTTCRSSSHRRAKPTVCWWPWLFSCCSLCWASVSSIFACTHCPSTLRTARDKIQFQIVAVLALIALFTHNHAFWIAGLLLALVPIPDFHTPFVSISNSLERIAAKATAPEIRDAADTGGSAGGAGDRAFADQGRTLADAGARQAVRRQVQGQGGMSHA